MRSFRTKLFMIANHNHHLVVAEKLDDSLATTGQKRSIFPILANCRRLFGHFLSDEVSVV